MESKLELQDIGKTAIWTLRARAEEHRQPRALFRDQRAMEWIERVAWPSELDAWYTRRAQMGISVRTRAIDDLLNKHLDGAQRPLVVELGCGLSSRYHRVGVGRTRWIDFDLPGVIAARRELDPETEEHRYLAGSLLDPSWIDALRRERRGSELIFVAEGLLMYFEQDQVLEVLRGMSRGFGSSALIFDTQGEQARKVNEKFTQRVNAPLRWVVKDERRLRELPLPLDILGVSSLFECCRQRLGAARLLYWLPSMRNINLFIESRLH